MFLAPISVRVQVLPVITRQLVHAVKSPNLPVSNKPLPAFGVLIGYDSDDNVDNDRFVPPGKQRQTCCLLSNRSTDEQSG